MSGSSCDKFLAWEDENKVKCNDCAKMSTCSFPKRRDSKKSGEYSRCDFHVPYTGSVTCTVEAVNPKEACGAIKPTMANISGAVMAEVGVGMHEGARKYGSHNYRVTKVFAKTYYASLLRHIISWYEGEDIDPDSGVPHISKLIACAAVLRDAEIQGMLVDDRPPKTPEWHKKFVQKLMDDVLERHPECVPAFTELGQRAKSPEEEITAAILPTQIISCKKCQESAMCDADHRYYAPCRALHNKATT